MLCKFSFRQGNALAYMRAGGRISNGIPQYYGPFSPSRHSFSTKSNGASSQLISLSLRFFFGLNNNNKQQQQQQQQKIANQSIPTDNNRIVLGASNK